MNELDDIKENEDRILKLSQDLPVIKSSWKKKQSEKKINALEFGQETAIMNYLEKDDEAYRKKLNENFDLLINDNIEFIVTQESGNPFSSYSKELYGEISSNGCLYFETRKTNFVYASFQAGFFPLSYVGLINYFGETSVIVEKKGFKFFGSRVPTRYKGSIDEDGNVYFKTSESYWEGGGYYFVNHIIADPFSDQLKREKFIENRIDLKGRIQLFRRSMVK